MAAAMFFAVGVILHELLTGQRLFTGASEAEILARLLAQPIPRPSELCPGISAELDEIVMSMLARERNERLASARIAAECLLESKSANPRAALELRDILLVRFPELAPQSADVSGPARAAQARHSSHKTPRLDKTPLLGATQTAGPERAIAVAGPSSTKPSKLILFVVALLLVAGAGTGIYLESRNNQSEVATQAANVVEKTRAEAKSETEKTKNQAANVAEKTKTETESETEEPKTDRPKPEKTKNQAANVAEETKTKEPKTDRPKPEKRKTKTSTSSKRKRPATIVVGAEPWAAVYLDGRRVGVTPQTIQTFEGSHKVVLVNDDLGKRKTYLIKLKPGARKNVSVTWP